MRTQHNKETFIREYCLARRIPYSIKRDQLNIAGHYAVFNIYNLGYADLINAIDAMCVFDPYTTNFVGLA